jgi:Tol biopolymer transport system component
VWVDRKGAETALSAPAQRYGALRLSPDGTRAATAINPGNINFDLWVYDLARGGNPSRVTFDTGNAFPVWTADSKRLLYFSFRAAHFELRSVPADNSGMPTTLLAIDNDLPFIPESASPDGKVLIGRRSASLAGSSSAWQLPLQGDSGKTKPQPLLDPSPTKTTVQFSPDGKWLAYSSNESGRDEIYVVPYPDSGGRSQVSTGGGTQPRWAHSGREVFYRLGDKLMAVDIQTSPSFRADTPKVLFEKPYPEFDVARDDSRFLMLKPIPGQPGQQTSELHVIVNWFEELRRRAPTGK